MVFITVGPDVESDPHNSPHMTLPHLRREEACQVIRADDSRGSRAGLLRDPVLLCCARWCQLQRAPRGKSLKMQAYLSNFLIMPRSRVRVPLSPLSAQKQILRFDRSL